MKRLLVLLLIPLFSLSSFGQKIDQLIKISKDLETFEIYALENGYEFHRMQAKSGLSFQKVTIINHRSLETKTEYLSSIFTNDDDSSFITYQGQGQEELPDIYRELKKLGFKLVNTEAVELFKSVDIVDDDIDWYVKEYSRGDTEKISVYIASNGAYEINYQGY